MNDFNCGKEPERRKRPTWCGDVDTTKPGEHYDVHHKHCKPMPDCGYKIPLCDPHTPGYTPEQQMNYLTKRVDELICLFNDYDSKVWGAYDEIVNSAIYNGAYYNGIKTDEGYIVESDARYKVIRIPLSDCNKEPIKLELGIAYNNTTNSGVKENMFEASENVIADKLVNACNTGNSWYGKVMWNKAPLPSSTEDGYTFAVTERGFFKVYPNSVDYSVMKHDCVENAMGAQGVLIQSAEVTPNKFPANHTELKARLGMGMNFSTNERFIIAVDGTNVTGCTSTQLAELFKKYSCTVAAEITNGVTSTAMDKGAFLFLPPQETTCTEPVVPTANAYWFISKKKHYHNDYVKDVALLMQRTGQNIWKIAALDAINPVVAVSSAGTDITFTFKDCTSKTISVPGPTGTLVTNVGYNNNTRELKVDYTDATSKTYLIASKADVDTLENRVTALEGINPIIDVSNVANVVTFKFKDNTTKVITIPNEIPGLYVKSVTYDPATKKLTVVNSDDNPVVYSVASQTDVANLQTSMTALTGRVTTLEGVNPVVDVSNEGADITFKFKDNTTKHIVIPTDPGGLTVAKVEYNATTHDMTITYTDDTTTVYNIASQADVDTLKADVTSLKTRVTALEGVNPITNVSNNENVITFTFKDTTTKNITIPTGEGGNTVKNVDYNSAIHSLTVTFTDNTTSSYQIASQEDMENLQSKVGLLEGLNPVVNASGNGSTLTLEYADSTTKDITLTGGGGTGGGVATLANRNINTTGNYNFVIDGKDSNGITITNVPTFEGTALGTNGSATDNMYASHFRYDNTPYIDVPRFFWGTNIVSPPGISSEVTPKSLMGYYNGSLWGISMKCSITFTATTLAKGKVYDLFQMTKANFGFPMGGTSQEFTQENFSLVVCGHTGSAGSNFVTMALIGYLDSAGTKLTLKLISMEEQTVVTTLPYNFNISHVMHRHIQGL